VQVYAGKQRATQAPHLFAIAEEAFAYAAHNDLQKSC
jgi:myosin heavy subunit